MWPHAKLVGYQKAMEVAILLDGVSRRIPMARRDLAKQLVRASSSIVLNIAEGASEYSLGDKAKFYRIARRSAAECSAILELLHGVGIRVADIENLQERLAEVSAILTGLIHHPPSRV